MSRIRIRGVCVCVCISYPIYDLGYLVQYEMFATEYADTFALLIGYMNEVL